MWLHIGRQAMVGGVTPRTTPRGTPPKSPFDARRGDARRRQRLLLLLLLLALLCVVQLAYWIASGLLESSSDSSDDQEEDEALTDAPRSRRSMDGPGTNFGTDWEAALAFLRHSNLRYVVIDAKNGLGNRLRAVASAMSVAEYHSRPVLLVWVRDLHLNCSISAMFSHPLPFALLEAEIPRQNLSSRSFQLFNYMRPEPGAIKDEEVIVDPGRHLFFRSAFVMNHPLGAWASGGPQRQIRRLIPSPQVNAKRVRVSVCAS